MSRKQLLEKILAPKKNFKNIKDRLPKNRFEEHSMDKIIENKSTYDEKNKENVLNFINTNKITRKDNLPSIRRSESLSHKNGNRVIVV